MPDIADLAQQHAELAELELAERIAGRQYKGASAQFCDDCDEAIPEARREAVRGCQTCMDCQELLDLKSKGVRRV